jgi:hypothetical protein
LSRLYSVWLVVLFRETAVVWFTASHIIYVISLLLVALLTQFILDN